VSDRPKPKPRYLTPAELRVALLALIREGGPHGALAQIQLDTMDRQQLDNLEKNP